MSRTIRRRKPNANDLKWAMYDHVLTEYGYWTTIWHEPDSAEYRDRLRLFHMDKYRTYKGYGPTWYRNMLTERPQRRESKRQITAYLKGEIEDVVLRSMDKLNYFW